MGKFKVINEEFQCTNCGENNPKAISSCRNHCRKCLFSMHLDEKYPGDRESKCLALMKPISLDKNGKKGWLIYHKCLKCGKIILNKAADDDNMTELINLSQKNEPPRIQKIAKKNTFHS